MTFLQPTATDKLLDISQKNETYKVTTVRSAHITFVRNILSSHISVKTLNITV